MQFDIMVNNSATHAILYSDLAVFNPKQYGAQPSIRMRIRWVIF